MAFSHFYPPEDPPMVEARSQSWKPITFKLSAKDADRLEDAAKQSHLKRSTFVRLAVLAQLDNPEESKNPR